MCASPGTLTTSAHPTSARTCPALAGHAQLDGERSRNHSRDVLDASRHLPMRERSTPKERATRGASNGERRHGEERGNALEREADRRRGPRGRGTHATRRDHEQCGHVLRRRGAHVATMAGDDEREPAFAEVTTTRGSRPGPYEGPWQM